MGRPQYESMDDDSTIPSVVFLNEDLDTIPERHAFLGNYRRFCSSIVECITRRRPFEAFPFIMPNVDNTLSSLYATEPPFACKFGSRWKRLRLRLLTVAKSNDIKRTRWHFCG